MEQISLFDVNDQFPNTYEDVKRIIDDYVREGETDEDFFSWGKDRKTGGKIGYLFLSCFSADLFIGTGLVEGIQIMAHHCLKFFADASTKALELEVILFGMATGIYICVE